MEPSNDLCIIFINFGAIFAETGKYDRGHLLLERVIKIAEKMNFRYAHCKALYMLGTLYTMLGNSENALDNLAQAEKKAREIGDSSIVSGCLRVMGFCMIQSKEYKEAIKKFEDVYNVCPTPGEQLLSYLGLGLSYLHLHELETTSHDNFDKSKFYYERALKLAEEQQQRAQIFSCLLQLGCLYVHHKTSEGNSSKDLELAFNYLDVAARLAGSCDAKRCVFTNFSYFYLRKYLESESREDKATALQEAEKSLKVAITKCGTKLKMTLTELLGAIITLI